MEVELHFVLFDIPKLYRIFNYIDKKHKKIDEMHLLFVLKSKKLTKILVNISFGIAYLNRN